LQTGINLEIRSTIWTANIYLNTFVKIINRADTLYGKVSSHSMNLRTDGVVRELFCTAWSVDVDEGDGQ